MSKKFAALLILTSGSLLALGFNCIPNLGTVFNLGGLLG
jgi:hypothetical protein